MTVSRDVRPQLRAMVLLGALAIVPYLNTLGAGFTFDDEFQIRKNSAVTAGVDPLGAFTSTVFGTVYRPLTILSFSFNEALTPGEPMLFHAANLVLHASVTVLVFLLALQLFGAPRLALVAGALFAVHPVHTEAVTSLVGRAELFAAFFGLIALLSAPSIDTAVGGGRRIAWQTVSLGAFTLALLSKENALTILPLIVLYRIVKRGEHPWGHGLWKELRSLDWVPYACCALVYVALRTYVTGGARPIDTVTPLNNILAFVPWSVRLRSALGVLWDYFGLLNVPLVLAADYSHAQVPIVLTWTDPRVVAGLLLVISSVVLAIAWRSPTLSFALVFPLVAVSLTANILFPIGTAKAERLLYLPSVGWVLLLAYVVERALRAPRYRLAAIAALSVVITAFATRTWERNWDWTDDLTLYQSMARNAPSSAKSSYYGALALQRRGDDERAVAYYRQALDIYPWLENAAVGIGVAFEQRGHVDAAVEWYRRALEVAPAHSTAHLALCGVLARAQRFVAAEAACRNGLRYAPADPELLKLLGVSLVGTGARAEGIQLLRRSLALNAHDDAVRVYLTRYAPAATASAELTVVQ